MYKRGIIKIMLPSLVAISALQSTIASLYSHLRAYPSASMLSLDRDKTNFFLKETNFQKQLLKHKKGTSESNSPYL